MNWLKSHKALLGWLLSFVVGGLKATGHDATADHLLPVATALLAAGARSDAYHRGE
jgi:hypothetical protein